MNMEINRTASAVIFPAASLPTKNLPVKSSSETSRGNPIEAESIWQKMASAYNVRHITAEETADLSQSLYDAGEISLLDHAILSFDPSRIPYGTGFLTEGDNTGHHDLISEYETRMNMDQKTGNRQNLVHDQRVYEYLKRLDAAGESHICITV